MFERKEDKKEQPKEIEESEEEEKAGVILSAPIKEKYYVVDDNGDRIQCKDIAEAKILSLLVEIKSLATENGE